MLSFEIKEWNILGGYFLVKKSASWEFELVRAIRKFLVASFLKQNESLLFPSVLSLISWDIGLAAMWKLHYEYHYRVLDIWLPNHLVEKVTIEAHKWQCHQNVLMNALLKDEAFSSTVVKHFFSLFAILWFWLYGFVDDSFC